MAIVKGIPGFGDVNFPESMSKDDINMAIQGMLKTPDKFKSEVPVSTIPKEQPKPWIGNPLSAWNSESPTSHKISEAWNKGMTETADLAEKKKYGQAYLHSLGTLGGAVGGALMAPFAAASPKLAQLASKGLAYAMNPRQPGEDTRMPMSVYGMPTGDVMTMPPSRPGTTVPEITAAHPTATRIAGDVVNTLSMIPAVKGPAIAAEQAGKQIIKPIGKAMVEEAVVSTVPKIIKEDINALHASMPSKFKKDLGTSDIIQQKKALENIVIEYGLDKFIRNKDRFQSKTLDLASKASDRADNEALKAFYPVKPSGEGVIALAPKRINPWGVAEDAIKNEKEKKSLGLFTGIKKNQLDRSFNILRKDWGPEWNEPKTISELIQFKREVLNKDGELFKKESDISAAERGELQVKKLIYHQLNDKIAEISPEYKKWNQESKNLFNLAETASKYSPVEKRSMIPAVGGTLGSAAGGSLGYTIGKWPGSAIGAAAGGTLGTTLGLALKGKPRSPVSLKEWAGRQLQGVPDRYKTSVSDVTNISMVPSKKLRELINENYSETPNGDRLKFLGNAYKRRP